jgi:head-tail adaptor
VPDQIGRRRTPVRVQLDTPTRDRLGQEQPHWATVATLWGYVRPATGRELAVAGQQNALLSHIVECRWPGSLVTVAPLHRLAVGSRYFNITWADNVEQRNRTLMLGCVERVEPEGG